MGWKLMGKLMENDTGVLGYITLSLMDDSQISPIFNISKWFENGKVNDG